MSYTTITLIVIASLVVLVLIHTWLHKMLKFKIDESAICQLFEDLNKKEQEEALSLEAIAKKTQIKLNRVKSVCEKSLKLTQTDSVMNLWQLAD